MISYVRARLAALRDEVEGQTLIEYALLAFLIAIVSILLLAAIGLDLAETFNEVEDSLGLGSPNVVDTPVGTDDQALPTSTGTINP